MLLLVLESESSNDTDETGRHEMSPDRRQLRVEAKVVRLVIDIGIVGSPADLF